MFFWGGNQKTQRKLTWTQVEHVKLNTAQDQNKEATALLPMLMFSYFLYLLIIMQSKISGQFQGKNEQKV